MIRHVHRYAVVIIGNMKKYLVVNEFSEKNQFL